MIIAALGSLALGLLCGLFVFPPEVIAVMDTVMSYALAVLIFSVGIEVGTNKTVFRKIREYNVRILVIPFGVAAASIAGAVLVGLLFGMPVNESAAIGSGFGFYSISAVIMRELGGAQLGTIAFDGTGVCADAADVPAFRGRMICMNSPMASDELLQIWLNVEKSRADSAGFCYNLSTDFS